MKPNEHDVSRIIDRYADTIDRILEIYGHDAFYEAIRRRSGIRAGMPELDDWEELRPIFEEAAREWLEHRPPYGKRSQKGIAKAVAVRRPGQSQDSTIRRIERKLREHGGTELIMLQQAYVLSHMQYPWGEHLRALEALAEKDPKTWVGGGIYHRTLGGLDAYREHHGEPSADMTMDQIEGGSDEGVTQFP